MSNNSNNNIFSTELSMIKTIHERIKAFSEKQDYCDYEGYDFEALHGLADDLKTLEDTMEDARDLIWHFRDKTRELAYSKEDEYCEAEGKRPYRDDRYDEYYYA